MSRHHLTEPRVREVIDRLVDLVLSEGSVNAAADALSTPEDENTIYPNRVRGLLSGDPTRSVNTATLEAVEDALAAAPPPDDERKAERRENIRRAVAALRMAGHDLAAAQERAAEDLGLPIGVVSSVVDDGGDGPSSRHARGKPVRVSTGPDWSWQDDAVAACLKSLHSDPNRKAGLVVPTGGGKTRIALRVILNWLAQEARDDTVVLWVTHRHRLKKQARDALFALSKSPDEVPEDANKLFADRVKFRLIQAGATEAVETYGDDAITLLVVDEAHHAAADSYHVLFDDLTVPGLFLTATPNRADSLPIGLDEIAYTITYRELFERGCVIEPIFDPPEMMPTLRWDDAAGLRELAEFLLDRTEHDFDKPLVGVTRVAYAERLYGAVIDLLDERPAHPFTSDDVAYVHGSGASGPGDPAQFLDDFTSRTRGILIGTSSLLGEGFDDPHIDAAVVTYPSQSISHLMQLAGRALRYAPGKDAAHVVQVHESELEYHFDQRWLYQDISDLLRPEIIDITYGSNGELTEQITALLDAHNVKDAQRQRVLKRLGNEIEIGEQLHLMLTGLPYRGSEEDFPEDAQWGALLVPKHEHSRFVSMFNTISDRDDVLKEEVAFLRRQLPPEHHTGPMFKAYRDLVFAMEFARSELRGEKTPSQRGRPYQQGRATTWLRYIALEFRPAIPVELDEFLSDATNRQEVLAEYLSAPPKWAAAVRIELPLTGSIAFLLDTKQSIWLGEQRKILTMRLRRSEPRSSFAAIVLWADELDRCPVPAMIANQIQQLLHPDRYEERYLELKERA